MFAVGEIGLASSAADRAPKVVVRQEELMAAGHAAERTCTPTSSA